MSPYCDECGYACKNPATLRKHKRTDCQAVGDSSTPQDRV